MDYSFIIDINKKNRTYTTLFAVITTLIGSISCLIQKNVDGINVDGTSIFLFGLVFFFTGLLACIFIKYGGCIILLSHAGSGFLIMLKGILGDILTKPFLSDGNNESLIICLWVIGILTIIASLSMIVYNVSDKIKKTKFGLLLPLILYTIPLFIASILPFIYI